MSAINQRLSSWGLNSPAARRNITGYIFISPFILGVLIWFLVPAATAGWLTFQKWNLITAPRFVGLDNIENLFEDELFLQSLKVTTMYTLVAVPLGLVLSFFIALLLNTKIRGISIYRTVYYLPSIVPAVASAVLWAFILNSEFGLLNAGLRAVGLPKILWLQEPEWALPALILMSLWGLGATMVIYLAGLQGIPDVYYEAAEIDGAGAGNKLIHVTIPLLSPVIFFNLVMGIIASFQIFTAGYLITSGGPQNATLFYVLYLYRAGFLHLKMGYAAALAWVLFIIIMGLTVLIFKYVGSMIYYEDTR
ncbi:MAG: sugar ABC transporter permease [Caldilineaceae bacterium]|nr:sugar ABC transporter permease [Caldilineaceae bacterium]MDE0312738.1 sugar ABC transporter permease [Caldilineaceae bacterium]MDE0630030.1 sugar ABC transporter permease [Caldilineaceae bacterium]